MLKRNLKIVLLIALIITIYYSLNRTSNLTKFETSIKDVLLLATNIKEKNSIDQTNSYLIQKSINESLTQEIAALKEQLNLNSTMTDFTHINATVISRNNISWLNTLTIDKGEKHGIEKDMAVITQNGLIGKISKTTKHTSEVKLLTSNDISNKISIMIKIGEEEHYAILSGYDHESHLLKVTSVDKNINIKNNPTVTTSNIGKMPQGIYIGDVVKTELDNYELSQTLYIKSKQNFNSIGYVSVLKEKK